MFKKVCTDCRKPSFSSCDTGNWLCPVCGKDISHLKLQAPEDRSKKLQMISQLGGQQIKHKSEHQFV
ncbi:hypothetical protein BN1002_02413 [Bacillus sp. B-jedd]|nr:hypothetical protein BN1002_02413 [Bacillus sp. B-jedd]